MRPTGPRAQEGGVDVRQRAQRQRAELESAAEPTFVRQHTALRSLIDYWEDMNADQRNALLRSIFENVIVGVDGTLELTPVEGWRPFLKSCLPHPRRVPNERKTGVKRAEVVTARLLEDERGWLRLAG